MMIFRKIPTRMFCLLWFSMMCHGMMLNGVRFKNSRYCLASNGTIVTVPRFLSCAKKCSTNPECRAFGYSAHTKVCRMSNSLDFESYNSCTEGEEVHQTGVCPAGRWTLNPISFTCIILVRVNLSWDEAKEHCEQSGDSLAAFPTLEHLEVINYQPEFYRQRGRIWIWLKKDDGKFKWQEQADILVDSSSNLWYEGFPTNTDECGGIFRNMIVNGECEDKRFFVCERQI